VASAGKSALSKVFQSVTAEPYLYLGLDTFFAAVPEQWSGGPVGRFRADGFEYVRPPQPDGQPFLQVAGRPESIHGLARGHYELMTKLSDVDLRLDATMPLTDLAAELVAHTSSLDASSSGIRLSLSCVP
jgi:chloramphenicol 3-O-phosphotransferase